MNEFSGQLQFLSQLFASCRIFSIMANCIFRIRSRNTGYAWFSPCCYPLNEPDKMDELGAFLGASYYRLLGKGQHYGESARGLAVDCGETDRGEEFPIFTDWWLGKPQHDDTELHLFAILDSVSLTGAYEFRIKPGETTVAEVEATLYLRAPEQIHAVDKNRKPIVTLGLAPLTEHVLVW